MRCGYGSHTAIVVSALYRKQARTHILRRSLRAGRENKVTKMALIPFDDRDGFMWMDGKMMPWRDAKIHVLSHGLHYGSCVFEGQRVYSGKIFKLEEHTDRLFTSAEVMGFKIPFTKEQINQADRKSVV